MKDNNILYFLGVASSAKEDTTVRINTVWEGTEVNLSKCDIHILSVDSTPEDNLYRLYIINKRDRSIVCSYLCDEHDIAFLLVPRLGIHSISFEHEKGCKHVWVHKDTVADKLRVLHYSLSLPPLVHIITYAAFADKYLGRRFVKPAVWMACALHKVYRWCGSTSQYPDAALIEHVCRQHELL